MFFEAIHASLDTPLLPYIGGRIFAHSPRQTLIVQEALQRARYFFRFSIYQYPIDAISHRLTNAALSYSHHRSGTGIGFQWGKSKWFQM